jgi:hypothetical protein
MDHMAELSNSVYDAGLLGKEVNTSFSICPSTFFYAL